MHPIKRSTLGVLLLLLAWPDPARALKVGSISATRSGGGILLKVDTDGEAKPKVSIVDGNKALIVVPGGQRAMKPLKVTSGILKGIRFGSDNGDLRIVADLSQAATASLGAVGSKGFEVMIKAADARADAAEVPKAGTEVDEASLNPASAGYTYRVVDLVLGGDEEQAELVISCDGPASYKSSLKEDGRLLSISFRNSSLAWSGDGAKLSDASLSGVSVRQLSEGGESVVKVDLRLREKLAYNLKRDQNQLVLRISRPAAAVAPPRSGDLETPVSIDVEDADIVSVMKALCQQAGFEYEFTRGILAFGPPDSMVTLRVSKKPFNEVTKTMLMQVGATYAREGNTLIIGLPGEVTNRKAQLPRVERRYAPKHLSLRQLTDLLRIYFALEPTMFTIAAPDPADRSRFLLVGSGGDVAEVMKALVRYDVASSGEESDSGGNSPRTQVFKLQYLDPNLNAGLISGAIQQLYTDTDDPVPSVLIDADTRAVVVTTKMKYLRKIEKLLTRIDVKPLQVNIEGKIVEMNQGMSRQLGVDWSAVQQQNSPKATMDFDTGLAAGFVSQLRYSTVQNGFNINSRLQAAVSENKADLVSAPNITVNDNQPAIINTSDTQISVNTTTTFNGNTTTITQQFNQVQIPLLLSVRPKISPADRRVLMEVLFTLTTLSGAPPVAGAPSPTSNQNARTSVNVNSGDTAVIGGLVRQNNIEVESKVPVLGDIPLLGLLFKFNTVDKTKKEVIIFITPTIVED